MKRIKIGEMALMNHISTQTLRLYDRIKLLEPEYLDEATGYRYYTPEQCAKLDLIKTLKSCDMPLEEIKELLHVTDTNVLAHRLSEQSGKLSEEIYRLSVSHRNLERIARNLRLLSSLPPFGQPYFEYMEERQIDLQETPYDFFSQGYEAYGKMIRYMQNYMLENQLPPSYFVNIGTIVEKDNFIRQRYHSSQAFIFVDELYPKRDTVRTLPQGLYIALVSNHAEDEEACANILRKEIERQNMQIAGDYICEVLSLFPFEGNGKLYFKIQIPVIRKG